MECSGLSPADRSAAEGLLDDNDFAYAYIDYDQLVGIAGHHVADDWLQTRARVEEGLLAAGAQAVEGNPKGPGLLRPVKKTIYKRRTTARPSRSASMGSFTSLQVS